MSRLKPSDRTDRRIQAFVDRGIFKSKTDVLTAAVELLVRQQLEADSKRQAEESIVDDEIRNRQFRAVNARP